jgi:hypothetical protein
MITIPLTKGFLATIDDADVGFAMVRWHAARCGEGLFYAARRTVVGGKSTAVYLHREILKAPPGMDVDHINGNTLDNRRENLRLATRSENNCNARRRRNREPGRKGISQDKRDGRWSAYVNINGRRTALGRFATAEEASRARDEAARRIHGEFARVNSPGPGERSA